MLNSISYPKTFRPLRWLALVLTLACINPVMASDSVSDDWQASLNVSEDLFRTLIRPNKHQTNVLLSATGVAAAAFFVDPMVRDYMETHRDQEKGLLYRVDDYYGDRYIMIGGTLGLYGLGLISGNAWLRETGLHAVQALLLSGVVTAVTKDVAGRARPYTGKGSFFFRPLAFKEKNRSFFSGHTSTTFAVSTVLAHATEHPAWKTLFYSAATLVGLARMYNDQHWFSDTVAGALVGYGVGRFVSRYSGTKATTAPLPGNTGSVSYFTISIPLR